MSLTEEELAEELALWVHRSQVRCVECERLTAQTGFICSWCRQELCLKMPRCYVYSLASDQRICLSCLAGDD